MICICTLPSVKAAKSAGVNVALKFFQPAPLLTAPTDLLIIPKPLVLLMPILKRGAATAEELIKFTASKLMVSSVSKPTPLTIFL